MSADPTPAIASDFTVPLDRTLVKAFLENVPDIVFFKDRDSRFIAVSHSKAQRHGLSADDLRGKNDADFYNAQHARWARHDEQTIMATGQPIVGKLERTQYLDGREGWAEVTKLPLRDDHGEIIGTFGLSKDVTETQKMAVALEKAQRDLVEASRMAGMAEVATGVLHNVGNVLTSLNVSANVIATTLHQSKIESLGRFVTMLQSQQENLARFLDEDPKGRLVPAFVTSLAQNSLEERDRLLREVASLQEHVDHIKEIVAMQQAYATMVGNVESLDPSALVEDALRMNASSLVRHDVTVVREFERTSPIYAERAKVLQILVNLIRNAKLAVDEGRQADKRIVLQVASSPRPGFVQVRVTDNGIGITAENLPRVFTHGFTTRKDGHGFGLHSAATTVKEMHGTLTVHSDGPGLGAAFTLELPTPPRTAEPAVTGA